MHRTELKYPQQSTCTSMWTAQPMMFFTKFLTNMDVDSLTNSVFDSIS